MLGSYSDKENLNQLHNFEEDDDEEIKLMLVIDKLREGNHVKGINGIVWLRQLDENSLILLVGLVYKHWPMIHMKSQMIAMEDRLH